MKNIVTYYKSYLGIDLENLNHPISKMIDLVFKTKEFDQNILKQRLRIIGLSLMEIKEYDEDIYNFYLKKIINNADLSVNGFFFEIIQCANLIKTANEENLELRFGNHSLDEPDFFLDNFGFELTMIRFKEDSNKLNADQKLLKKFREKNKKDYANNEAFTIN